MSDGWTPEENMDLSEEIQKVADWIDEKNRFVNGSESPDNCREKLEEIDLTELFQILNYTAKENDSEECYTLSAG